MKRANSSGVSACTSAKLRSVQSPESVSIRRASSRGVRPMRRATMSAVSRARSSGLHHSATNSKASGLLGQLGGLRAPGLVERDRALALEATLGVVGGLAVAGEVHAGRP